MADDRSQAYQQQPILGFFDPRHIRQVLGSMVTGTCQATKGSCLRRAASGEQLPMNGILYPVRDLLIDCRICTTVMDAGTGTTFNLCLPAHKEQRST